MLSNLIQQFEKASQAYATTNGIDRDPDWFILKLQEEVGELTQTWNQMTGRGRRKGETDAMLALALANEVADVFGHVLLLAGRNNIDLAAAIERKWRFVPEEAS